MRLFCLIPLLFLMLTACGQDENEQQNSDSINKKTSEAIDVSKEIDALRYSYDVVPKNMTVQEKKKRFRQLMLPAVNKIYAELSQQHEHVRSLIKSGEKRSYIETLKADYKAKSDEDLLARLKPHPVSIVLAQAAMESAWATSRFFRKAKNVFGIWSFDADEPRIAAGEQRGNKTIWLKKYKSIEDSIRDNYRVLARGKAYEKFRKLRLKTDNPFELVKGLDQYSEIGSKYGEELSSMIRFNKFNKLDL